MVEPIQSGLRTTAERHDGLKLENFANNYDVFNAAQSIFSLLPENPEDAKSKRQEGIYKTLPVENTELIAAIENYNLGSTSQILTDKTGKGLSLTKVHNVLS